jgi:gamma-glutamyl-gamma-aminobutyrate hydrolase PuuD
MSIKVLILGSEEYKRAFDPNEFTCHVKNWHETDEIIEYYLEHTDVLCFTGGEDVEPEFFGENRLPDAPDYLFNPERDRYEAKWYRKAKVYDTPCVGICRGAQFLNVMNGGKLIQDVANHQESHGCWSYSNPGEQVITVSSDHHNMMVPSQDAEILLYALEGDHYKPEGMYNNLPVIDANAPSNLMVKIDPEVVLYRLKKDLCHQPHPEWVESTSQYWKYFNHTVRRLVNL